MEIMRLEEENASLREMLSIANEIPVEDVDIPEPVVDPDAKSPMASRKGSIAVEELEADAAREADEEARVKMLSSELGIDSRSINSVTEQVEMLTDTPGETEQGRDTSATSTSGSSGASSGGTSGLSTGGRPILSGSMLGFQAEGPPPEHVIADEVEGEDLGVEPL
jgi:hypothetical protein